MKYQEGKVTRHTESVHLLFQSIGWVECEGHILTLYNHHFSIVPFQNGDGEFTIRVSDLLSGRKFVEVPVPDLEEIKKLEQFLEFCETTVLAALKLEIGSLSPTEFSRTVKSGYIKAVEMYGPKPIPETNRG